MTHVKLQWITGLLFFAALLPSFIHLAIIVALWLSFFLFYITFILIIVHDFIYIILVWNVLFIWIYPHLFCGYLRRNGLASFLQTIFNSLSRHLLTFHSAVKIIEDTFFVWKNHNKQMTYFKTLKTHDSCFTINTTLFVCFCVHVVNVWMCVFVCVCVCVCVWCVCVSHGSVMVEGMFLFI